MFDPCPPGVAMVPMSLLLLACGPEIGVGGPSDDRVTVEYRLDGEPLRGVYVVLHGPDGEPYRTVRTNRDGLAHVAIEPGDILSVAAVIEGFSSNDEGAIDILSAVSLFGVSPGDTLHLGGLRPPPVDDRVLEASVAMPEPLDGATQYAYDLGCGLQAIVQELPEAATGPLTPGCLDADDQVAGVLHAYDADRELLAMSTVDGVRPDAPGAAFSDWRTELPTVDMHWELPPEGRSRRVQVGAHHPAGSRLPFVRQMGPDAPEAEAIRVAPDDFGDGTMVAWSGDAPEDTFAPRAVNLITTEPELDLTEELLPPGLSATYDAGTTTFDIALEGDASRDGLLTHTVAVWGSHGFAWTLVAPTEAGPLVAPRIPSSLASFAGLGDLGEPDLVQAQVLWHSAYPTDEEALAWLSGEMTLLRDDALVRLENDQAWAFSWDSSLD